MDKIKSYWLKIKSYKHSRKIGISLLVILSLFIIIHFAINLFIKYKLPDYIKENADYSIKYKSLDVDFYTGNLFANQFFIENKDAQNKQVFGVKGSVDTIRIKRIEMLNLLFGKKIKISDVELVRPQLNLIFPEEQSNKKTDKKIAKSLVLKSIKIKDGTIQIEKAGKKIFSSQKLDLYVQNIHLFDPKNKNVLPFDTEDFTIDGEDFIFENGDYAMSAKRIKIDQNQGNFYELKIKTTPSKKNNFVMDAQLKSGKMKLNSWNLEDNILTIDNQQVILDSLQAKIKIIPVKSDKNKSKEGLKINALFQNIRLINSDLAYNQLNLSDFNANIKGFKIDNSDEKNPNSLSVKNYEIASKSARFDNEYYNFTFGEFVMNEKSLGIKNFSMKPKYSRQQFIRIIPAEKDLYNIVFEEMKMQGKWDVFSAERYLDASSIWITGVKANIFRSKIPKDDLKTKPFYSELLRSIQLPFYVAYTEVQNSFLEYEEDTKKSNGPGKLTFSDLNLKIQHLNSGKMKGKSTRVPIVVESKFFSVSPMKVHWTLDTSNKNDDFTISGNISSLPSPRINQFVEPYLKIRTTGKIQNLDFNFKGNKNGIGGDFKIKHKDLKVSLLNDKGKKKKFLSAVVNIFINTNSGKYPESVKVEHIERDRTKSFFNLFWKGIESGLVKTLVGETAEDVRQDLKTQ